MKRISEKEKLRVLKLHESTPMKPWLIMEKVPDTNPLYNQIRSQSTSSTMGSTYGGTPTAKQPSTTLSPKQVGDIQKFAASEVERSKLSLQIRNQQEGDNFRKWVNKFYKSIADSLGLDEPGPKNPTPSFNNDYIVRAWNYVVPNKNQTLGSIYQQYLYDNGLSPSFQWQESKKRYENQDPSTYTPPTSSVQYTDYYSPGAYIPSSSTDELSEEDKRKMLHNVLMVAGLAANLIPVVGPLVSLGIQVLDGGAYIADGDYYSGGLSLALSLIPASSLINKIPAVKKFTESATKAFISKITQAAKGLLSPMTRAEIELAEQIASHGREIMDLVRSQAISSAAKVTNPTLKLQLSNFADKAKEFALNYGKEQAINTSVEQLVYKPIYNKVTGT